MSKELHEKLKQRKQFYQDYGFLFEDFLIAPLSIETYVFSTKSSAFACYSNFGLYSLEILKEYNSSKLFTAHSKECEFYTICRPEKDIHLFFYISNLPIPTQNLRYVVSPAVSTNKYTNYLEFLKKNEKFEINDNHYVKKFGFQ